MKKWQAIPPRSGVIHEWTERLGQPWPQVPPLHVEAGVPVTVEHWAQPCALLALPDGYTYPLPFSEAE